MLCGPPGLWSERSSRCPGGKRGRAGSGPGTASRERGSWLWTGRPAHVPTPGASCHSCLRRHLPPRPGSREPRPQGHACSHLDGKGPPRLRAASPRPVLTPLPPARRARQGAHLRLPGLNGNRLRLPRPQARLCQLPGRPAAAAHWAAICSPGLVSRQTGPGRSRRRGGRPEAPRQPAPSRRPRALPPACLTAPGDCPPAGHGPGPLHAR